MQPSMFEPDEGQSFASGAEAAEALLRSWRAGILGGNDMPEDAAPSIADPEARLCFFTLPMALNYQRNSYNLWTAAAAMWADESARPLFSPDAACATSEENVRTTLTRYKVALQPVRHVEIWTRIADTLSQEFGGRVSTLLQSADRSVEALAETVQVRHKRGFPYLSGPKIFNYWLYVIEQYCQVQFKDRHLITVAPDTHVMQSTERLGLVPPGTASSANGQAIVTERWLQILTPMGLCPIDIHTPLWLWSRGGFTRLLTAD